MDLSELDFILIILIGYCLGIATGLLFCMKYRNVFLTRSKSVDNFKNMNHQNIVYPPDSAVIQASAPPVNSLPKITIS